MMEVVMTMEFIINKYSQVSNRAGLGYGGLAKFIIMDRYNGFSWEGHNFSFTDDQFHVDSSAPTFCTVTVRL
jgi:hypothetical protein